MKAGIKNLWKVPVYCVIASWISFYLIVYIGRLFFMIKTIDTDGITHVSVNSVGYVIVDIAIFLIVLLIGGLWVFRSMTKAEVAISAGIMSAIYLLTVFVQMYVPDLPIALNDSLIYIQTWMGTLSSLLAKLTDHRSISIILSSFSPLLFILFARKSNT